MNRMTKIDLKNIRFHYICFLNFFLDIKNEAVSLCHFRKAG